MSTPDLTGKVAIVTGAGSGIGRATGLLFARCGARVAVADVDADRCERTAAEIAAAGGTSLPMEVDVADHDACGKLVERVLREWGQLDVAFNNAGIIDRPPARTAELSRAGWDRALAVNLTGVFNCMQHEIRAMRERGGVIVNTSSIRGLRGAIGGAAYCASKYGVIGLTKAAALEYGRERIRVNAICPGYVATPMTVGADAVFDAKHLESMRREVPLGRFSEADEVAAVVAWLCSDGASYVNGVALPVDGGVDAG